MADIEIVGLGLRAVDHLTLEADRALRDAREVLFVDTGIGTREILEARSPRVTDLFAESYVREGARLDAYRHMAVRTVEAALDHAPVAFAIHGHPTVFVYAPFLIRDMATLLGLSVRVLPGISAMDVLLADRMLDPAVGGMQVYEATDLLLRRRPLQPDVPALLWQVGNVETRLHADHPSRPERLDRLVAWMLRFYPPDHEVEAIFCSPHPLVRTRVTRVALSRLRDHAAELHAGVTLYVPPVGARPIEDLELLRLLDDPAHLARITFSTGR